MNNNVATIFLIISIFIFLLGNTFINYLSFQETKRHYKKTETISIKYKENSIRVSEEFNKEIKALGE